MFEIKSIFSLSSVAKIKATKHVKKLEFVN